VTILAAQIPDSPTGLVNVEAQTTLSSAGLSWSAPSFNSGSPIIDYRVWTDDVTNGGDVFINVITVVSTDYIATGLT
jgi:hypothetical protein